jgi:ankyrin repeat protein
MSAPRDPRTIDLDQLRKRAKELRRAHRDGAHDAAARIAAQLPRARGHALADVLAGPFALSEAQLVVARENGYESWPRLVHAVEAVAPPDDERVIDAALAGKSVRVAAPLSLYAAAAIGDAERVLALIGDDVDARGGRRGWTPLLYACCARHGRGDPGVVAARVRIARTLLERGADVDAVGRDGWYSTEDIDGFDVEQWVPLGGAVGRVASTELARVVLDHSPDVERAPQLLKQAVYSGDLGVLEAALAARPPWWQAIWALEACAALDRIDMARVLVPYCELPKWREPAVLRAIRDERSVELVLLLVGEAPSHLHEVAYRAACRHHHPVADRLPAVPLDDRDRAIAGERLAARWRDDDHRMLSWVIAHGHLDRVPHLLAIGLDPDTPDERGELPLHHAVRAGSRETIDRLVAAGAALDAPSFDGTTPLALALAVHPQLAPDLLARGAREPVPARDDLGELFERAAQAVTDGDLETLRALLDDEPALVHARSPRAHRATLLHYCGANGTERQATPPNAPAICELLLARGADANATCNLYGGGATTLGLVLTSVHPATARLDGELVRVLVRHGAHIDDADVAVAVQYALPRALAALVDGGAPIDLFVAAALDRVDLVDARLAAGVDVDTRFGDGYTALHAAAGMGHARMVEHLLARGADRTLRDTRWNGTPADKARYFEHPEVAALLD